MHICALEEVASISKTLMDATGHAFLIQQDSNFRSRTLGNGLGWEEDYDPIPPRKRSSFDDVSDNIGIVTQNLAGPEPVLCKESDARKGPLNTVRSRRAAHQESEQLIQQAIAIYKEKDSIKKAVQFLVSKNFMPNTPPEVSTCMLRRHVIHSLPRSARNYLTNNFSVKVI